MPESHKSTSYISEAKKEPKNEGFKLISLFTVISLITVLLGKILFSQNNENTFLFAYGITVTWIILLTFFVRYRSYRDPYEKFLHRRKGVLSVEPLVSAMVAVYNEEDTIEECLDSIRAQGYGNMEVLVVNDASTDRTREILDSYKKKHPITVIHLEENQGKKKALAHAMLRAQGSVYAFTDSDSMWARDAVQKCVEILDADPDVGAVSGHTRALNAHTNTLTRIQDSWYEGQFAVRKAFESVFDAVTCVSGPLAVFRKEAIFNFIPAWIHDRFAGQEFKFATDRTLTAFLLGNPYVGQKLKEKYKDSPFVKAIDYPEKEWKVVYTEKARAWTKVPDTFKRFSSQQVRWKKSFIRNMFFMGRFYWRKPFPAALVFYLHILFVFVGPFVVFRHLIYLPLQGNLWSAVLYFSGVVFIGFLFGLDFKKRNKWGSRWRFRPLMSMISTFVLSWFIYYSALTITDMTWRRQ